MGGLSGRPLTPQHRSHSLFSPKSKNAFPIIGVGGIHKPQDAIEKLEAGAASTTLYRLCL